MIASACSADGLPGSSLSRREFVSTDRMAAMTVRIIYSSTVSEKDDAIGLLARDETPPIGN